MNTFSSELSEAVKNRRKALRLTQRQLADLAGCHYMFVSDLEQGKPTLRLDKVESVLLVLGLRLQIEG